MGLLTKLFGKMRAPERDWKWTGATGWERLKERGVYREERYIKEQVDMNSGDTRWVVPPGWVRTRLVNIETGAIVSEDLS